MLASAAAWFVLGALALALALGIRYRRPQTLIAAGSLVLTLVATELVLRGLYPPSWRPLLRFPSREYHHIDRPNAVMYEGRVEGQDIVVRTNQDGFRSAYSREEFVRHRERIVVLGDSFAFGADVAQADAFPQVMERILRQRPGHEDLAVLNAGTISATRSPGFSSRFAASESNT